MDKRIVATLTLITATLVFHLVEDNDLLSTTVDVKEHIA